LCNGIREEDDLIGDVEAIAQAIVDTLRESSDPRILRALVAQFSSEAIAGEYGRLLLEHQTDLSSRVAIGVSR